MTHAKSTKHLNSISKQANLINNREISNGHSFKNLIKSNGDQTIQKPVLPPKRSVFNDKWLREPFFKPWLRRIPSTDTKALCIACRSILVAGRSELVKHTLVAKHKKAVAAGFDQDFNGFDLDWLSPDFKLSPNMSAVMAVPASQSGGSGNNSHGDGGGGMPLSDVVKHLNEISPLHLAEPWDNVGLLIKPTKPLVVKSAIITNDLTEKVMAEAIENEVNLIISYHPPIFKPLKRLVGGTWKETIVTNCIESGMALYSPHTALDAIKGGINDWLVESFGELANVKPITQSTSDPRNENNYSNCIEFVTNIDVAQNLYSISNAVITVKNTEYESGGVEFRICCNDDSLPKVYEIIAQNPSIQVTSRLSKLVTVSLSIV